MNKECVNKNKKDNKESVEIIPISKEDFLREYPIYEKPTFNVGIGANSCNICS